MGDIGVCWQKINLPFRSVDGWTGWVAYAYIKPYDRYGQANEEQQTKSKDGRCMDLVTLMTLKLTAQRVGTDRYGNRYYEERRARSGKPPRRYVRYNGIAEASKVPADWHGWLHHTELSPPPEGGYDKYEWQREHQPNVTGTVNAYRPQGHMLKGKKRKPTGDDYEPWNPA